VDWTWKGFAIMVGVGVVTTIAIEFAMKFLRDQAILCAKAEMQKLIVATQATAQPEVSSVPSAPQISTGNQGYTNIDALV